jgi:hypothetical protein
MEPRSGTAKLLNELSKEEAAGAHTHTHTHTHIIIHIHTHTSALYTYEHYIQLFRYCIQYICNMNTWWEFL